MCIRDSGKAYDGGQFAELNCQAYGALYQDVLTVPGATLNWSLAHAGRDGTDTMALLIAPVDVAQDITGALKNKTTRAAIQEALNGSIMVNGVNVPIRNYIAVSYTHLDVYKRQADGSPPRYAGKTGQRLRG